MNAFMDWSIRETTRVTCCGVASGENQFTSVHSSLGTKEKLLIDTILFLIIFLRLLLSYNSFSIFQVDNCRMGSQRSHPWGSSRLASLEKVGMMMERTNTISISLFTAPTG